MKVERKPATLRVTPANLLLQGSFNFCLYTLNPRISARGAYFKFIKEKTGTLSAYTSLFQALGSNWGRARTSEEKTRED